MKRFLLSHSLPLASLTLSGHDFEKTPDGKVFIYCVGTNDIGAMNNFKYFIDYGLNLYTKSLQKLKTINSTNVF
jgi:hypothetical protein